jgi:hypothetical protein
MIEAQELVKERLQRRDIRSRIAYRLETVNLLAHVVTRTRKRDVNEWRIIREPIPEFVELDPEEERFYNLVTEIVINYAQQRDANERFLLAQPQRQMTSSMAASLRSWQSRLVELEEAEETGERDEDEERRGALGPLVTSIVRRSRDDVDLDHLIKVDTKYHRLKEIVVGILQENPKEKVVIFSAFRATLMYLDERLGLNGVSCIQLTGGQRESKDDIIQRFVNPHGPSVLLSSEVGGEGIDLQFSRIVINYDLPWNPMRLEQRIGRVDRLGQKAERVLIWNVLYANTIDARIYQRLYDKLDLCRTALGDFEAILGDEIRRLEVDLLSAHLTAEQQERRIDQTAQALETRRLQEQKLEQDASSLVAYGDYILNQIHASREFHRWISGEDIQRYVFDHLRLHYPGCKLIMIEKGTPRFQIELSDKAKCDLTEFIRRNRITITTRLTSTLGRPITCLFDNRIDGASVRGEEVITQFHPLVRMISNRIAEGDEQLTPAVSLVLNRAMVEASIRDGIFVLAVTLWSFRGLQDMEKLAYAAVRLDDPCTLLEPDMAEQLAVAAVSGGEDWIEARNLVDLKRVYEVVNNMLLGHLDEEYNHFYQELRARNEDRADIQLHTLEQHLQQQTMKLEAICENHRAYRRESLVLATEGRIKALKGRVEQQRILIEKRRVVRSESREITIAIISVGSDKN